MKRARSTGMARKEDFKAAVPLPPGLETGAIRRAVDYIERELVDLIDLYYEQANVFSAVVGIFGTRALDSFSNYEKHRHLHTAQDRKSTRLNSSHRCISYAVFCLKTKK